MANREQDSTTKAKLALERALEEIDKRQYWNAVHATNEAERHLIVAYDCVLKGIDKY